MADALKHATRRYIGFRPVARVHAGESHSLAGAGVEHFAVSGVDGDMADSAASRFEEQQISDAQIRFIDFIAYGGLSRRSPRQRHPRLIEYVLHVRGAIKGGSLSRRRAEFIRRSDVVFAEFDQV